MRFVIVTGMSGAGKSTALKMLEDMGYFCVDNLPISMFPGFVQMIENSETSMKKWHWESMCEADRIFLD
mgnify:CR=1 FL=1